MIHLSVDKLLDSFSLNHLFIMDGPDFSLMQTLQTIDTIDFLLGLDTKMRAPKILRKRPDPFSTLCDEEFIRMYRFSKATALMIVNLVKDDLKNDPRGSGTSPSLQVLTALRCWGLREMQEDVANQLGLSQPTISRICSKVARAIARHSNEYIKMPTTIEEQEANMHQFKQIKDMTSVIGCIGCTHIKIRKDSSGPAQYHINKKKYNLMNAQVTCDANLKIMDLVAQWRGSTNKVEIFNKSDLKIRLESEEFNGRLIGDTGYECGPYVLIPILWPMNQLEEKYNETHCSTLKVVDQCFEVWKQRFQCLLYGMTVHLHNVNTTIVALAVLHNIAILNNEVLPDIVDPVNTRVNKNAGNTSVASAETQNTQCTEFDSIDDNDAMLQTFLARHFNE